jgi:HD-like signal output (HDOD) protein
MLIRSFVTGLFARHLTQRQKLRGAEEAFIYGMFQSLGETLTMFYFVEEHQDIEEERQNSGASTVQAAKSILGITYAQLGAAIARDWRFPSPIVEAIEGVDENNEVPAPASDCELLRNVCCFADRLCQILGRGDAAGPSSDAMLTLHKQVQQTMDIEVGLLPKLANAALDRLDQHAAILGVNPQTSTWCKAARQCIEASEQLQAAAVLADLKQAQAVA